MRLLHIKHVQQCLEHIKCSINSNYYYSQLFLSYQLLQEHPVSSMPLSNHSACRHPADARRCLPDFSLCLLALFFLIFVTLFNKVIIHQNGPFFVSSFSFSFKLKMRIQGQHQELGDPLEPHQSTLYQACPSPPSPSTQWPQMLEQPRPKPTDDPSRPFSFGADFGMRLSPRGGCISLLTLMNLPAFLWILRWLHSYTPTMASEISKVLWLLFNNKGST